ncbi:MAG TPA: class I SAM-dependent methyltransferase [Candidatus Paceibacterota bacterium]|nr:class I SAM-dependent methyltransferase [Candidatus Paceibacterota bacterium]
MQKTTEQAGEWQEIWERSNWVDTVIDWGRTVYNFFFRRILRRYLSRDSVMLELGCGRASLSLSLAPEIQRLVGVDISESAVRQAAASAEKQGLTNTSFIIDDCTKLATEERFDFVWSQGLLEHFEDPVTVAREHYRVLKPGGTALLSVPYKYSYHTVWYTVARPKMLRWVWPWTEQRFFDKAELLAVGKEVTPTARTYFLQPFPLGIIFLEMRKPLGEK